MSKRKATICTVLLTFVVYVVAIMLYQVKVPNGLNLFRSISMFLLGWFIGGKIIDFYYWLLRK